MLRRPATPLAIVALVAGLTLASCAGSSGSEGADATTTAAATDEATTTTTSAADAPAVPSAGCGTSSVRSVVQEKTYLDDSDRWFLLSTPLEHDGETPIPLVLDYHGLSEGAEVHAKMSDLAAFGDDHGFVVVQPQGLGTPVRWQIGLTPDDNPDLQYTIDLLDQVEAELCIDTARVYATGLSNGAFFSSVLACSLADRIAAVAPVAGAIRPDGCDPARPVPVLAFHGTADPILLFNGGVGDRLNQVLSEGPGAATTDEALPAADIDGPGYPANVARWAADNGCEGDPTDEPLTDTITERTWDCPPGADVEFLIIDGGGHSWPGSAFSKQVANMVGPTDDFDANTAIWDFFQRFSLPA
ncbi:MAG: PHB depolymerase family esterase [Acidimicrobiales bacterium]